MGTLQQEYHNVQVYTDNGWQYISSDGFKSLPTTIEAGSNEHISKVSIQAPSGYELNIDNKTIIIGRSGLYDLDNEDLEIKKIEFKQPHVASISYPDTSAYETALDSLQQNCSTLIATTTASFANQLIQPIEIIIDGVTSTITSYQLASDYLQAKNGIVTYTETGDANNIIINYVVEEEGV